MDDTSAREFEPFLRELRALMHRLQVMGSLLHGEDNIPGSLRTLLARLEAGGPQTIPQLARLQSVSRQQIQVAVRGLEGAGLVQREANPAHRTSHLVRLAPEGRNRLRALRDKEEAALRSLRLPFEAGLVAGTGEGLRRIREALDRVCEALPHAR